MSPLLSPLLIIFVVALYGLVHSWLASLRLKAILRNQFGELANRFYRLAYNVFAAVTFLPVVVLTLTLPDKLIYRIPFPWVLLTIAVQGAAVFMLLIGLLQTGLWSFLGLRQLLTPPGETSEDLVVKGLYRWMRHPLYTAGLIFIWLTPILTINLLTLIIGLSAYLVVGAYVEERKLVVEYGEAYIRYQDRTPMLLPIRFANRAGTETDGLFKADGHR